ncbi:MAG: amidohydrolase family protein [Anaerolineaceae bacterium]
MDLVIRNGISDKTGTPIEVGINGGKIVAVEESGIPQGSKEIDAEGCMISPAFIEPHFHLENALIWGEALNQSGTLQEAIDLYAKIKPAMPLEDIVARASRALRTAIGYGTLWMRSHVDIDQVGKLHLLEGQLAVREKFKDAIDIQLIAFPQLGLARNPEAVDLMWQAMERGADVVGGMPHGERDMDDAARHIEIAFEIAKKYNADIDMHVDETDNGYWRSLEVLADQTIENGWQGRVTAGHCCAMAAWDEPTFQRVLEKVIKARIQIVTNAPVNLFIQGRADAQPKRRGIPRVRDLIAAGVTVACGQDDLQNMFYPYGSMDMLEVAMITAHAAHLSSPAEIQAAFDMPRYSAARGRRIQNYGVAVGADANLVVLDAASPIEALRRQPDRRYVIRQGQVLSETRTQRVQRLP